MPIKSPARAIAPSVNCMARPRASPMSICSAASTAVAHDRVSGSEWPSTAARRAATTNASVSFARAGNAIELNGGAAKNNAAVRRNGQKNSPSQRASSASLTVINRSSEGGLYCRDGTLDIVGHPLRHPCSGEKRNRHDGDETRDEAQRQIADPRGRLKQANHEAGYDRCQQERGGECQRHNQHAVHRR